MAPATALEEQIAAIWRDAMGLQSVGVNSNFFDLGGTSLMLEEIHSELHERLDAELSVAVLFQYPTVQSLAKHLVSQPGGDGPSQPLSEQTQDYVTQQAQRRRQAAARRKR